MYTANTLNTQRPMARGMGQRSKPARSQRAQNLQRLLAMLDFDMTSAALGVQESTLRQLVEDKADWDAYLHHIRERLEKAGLPWNLFDRAELNLSPANVVALKTLAASSADKAPTRRNNFKRLVALFEDRINVLADALEVIPESLYGIVNGRLIFEDQRFGHMNPKLVRAGFPDEWLDTPDAEIQDAWVRNLETMAADSYEEELEYAAQAAQRRAAEAAAAAASANTPELPATAELVAPAAPAEPQKPSAAAQAPAAQPSAPAIPKPLLVQPTTAAMSEKPEFKPQAAAPSKTAPRPSFQTGLPLGLSRTAIIPGRSFPKRGETKATLAPSISPAAALPLGKLNTPATPSSSPAAQQVRQSAPPQLSRPRGRGKREDATSLTQSIARANALSRLLETSRRGAKVCLWRDLLGKSLPYWANIKKGDINFNDTLADAVVSAMGLPADWLDNPQFPPATLAAWVTDPKTPLPATPGASLVPPVVSPSKDNRPPSEKAPVVYEFDKLDSRPSIPVEDDDAVELPIYTEEWANAPSGLDKRGFAEFVAEKPKASQVPTVAAPKFADSPKLQQTLQEKQPAPVAQATVAEKAAAPAKTETEEAPTATPAAAPAPAAKAKDAANRVVFAWTPCATPVPREAAGPAVETLKSLVDALGRDGTLTEADAYRLIGVLASSL